MTGVKTEDNLPRFRLGADPEFLFMSSSKHVIPAPSCAQVGSAEEFGCDAGGGIPGELRPPPKEEPADLVAEIHRVLVQGYNTHLLAQLYDWSAGHNHQYNPTGGHIHFGNPATGPQVPREAFPTRWMDLLLALPIAFLERPNGLRCRNSSYGRLSDVREKEYGFEYRSLGSWLTSPHVAYGVLCMAKTIYTEWLLSRQPTPTTGTTIEWMAQLDPQWEIIRTAYPTLADPCRQIANEAWLILGKMRAYPKYAEGIQFLKRLYDGSLSWYPACGMKAAWGIPRSWPYHTKRDKTFSLEKLLEVLDA